MHSAVARDRPWHVARDKDLAGFDFAASEINEATVRTLHRGEFRDGAQNVVLIGGPGTGKTHVATPLGIQAIEHRPPGMRTNHHRFQRIPIDPVRIKAIGRLAPEVPVVERRALRSVVVPPDPFNAASMRMVVGVGIKIILARHPSEGAIAVTAVRDDNIVANLKTGPKREEGFDIGILAGCIGVLLVVPRFSDFLEIVEPLVRPVDITTPAQMDQLAIEAFVDPVFLAAALAKGNLVDRARAVEPLCRRIAIVEPRPLADDLEYASMGLEAEPSRSTGAVAIAFLFIRCRRPKSFDEVLVGKGLVKSDKLDPTFTGKPAVLGDQGVTVRASAACSPRLYITARDLPGGRSVVLPC